MKQTELKGIITPILTPMNADESINTDELRTQAHKPEHIYDTCQSTGRYI